MTDDFIDATFADLDVFYPGSKRKRREPKVKEVKVDVAWDSQPFMKPLPNGTELEMFTVGALAQALGRPFASVRLWNKNGYLPRAPYRLPTKKNKHGEEHKGRRLYSRAMIEAAVDLFDKAGLLEVKRIEWSEHQQLTIEIAEAWTKIQATEMNNQAVQS